VKKQSPPYLLPKNFPLHAPLPPGGPWIRQAPDDDWDEVTVAMRPDPEPRRREQLAPQSGWQPPQRSARQEPPRSAPRAIVGFGNVPSLTPLSMVEASVESAPRRKSA